MTLGELVRDLPDLGLEVRGDAGVEVRGVACDSRTVAPGDLFVALPGTHTDGRRFIAEACTRGAAAVAGPPSIAAPAGVPFVATPAPARLLARVAARVHGDPTAALVMVGVTGTNGKTTVSYLLEAIWEAAGARPGVFGTISYRFGGAAVAAPLTTPPAPELFARLAAMRAGGATHVVMEVSSHALVQDRVEGVAWDAAVFTNLGRDHLDFHRDQDEYFEAKARLFMALDASPKPRRIAVLNAGDPRALALRTRVRVPVVTFGAGGDVRAEDVRMTLAGTAADLVFGRGTGGETARVERAAVRSRLVGAGHLENVLAAAAAARALGAPLEAIVRGIEGFAGVSGRLEPVAAGQDFTVLVDYAHTPEALAGVLGSLRALVPGRLLCVFGCGGDRDRGKRPLMGEAVGRSADLAVLTSDNPRTEDPLAIIADAEPGLARAGLPRVRELAEAVRGYVVLPDRTAAIAAALAAARSGDCVVIAGKGHEDYQIVGTEKRPFDDRTAARAALAARRAPRRSRAVP
jgi:UDP-N-acetylmuramoyl-L-alanyl-D-glutamate--2,6-diaminopimelate ligase